MVDFRFFDLLQPPLLSLNRWSDFWGPPQSHILDRMAGFYRMSILLRATRLPSDDGLRIGLFFLTKLTKFQEFDCIKV